MKEGREVSKTSIYRWRGRDKQGKAYSGELWADDEKEVAEFIRENFGYVIKIKERHPWKYYYENLLPNLIVSKSSFLETFFSEMAVMINSGIPMLHGLEMLHSKMGKQLQSVTLSLMKGLKEGKSLAEAMEQQTDFFPKTTVKVIAAGENSGSMGKLFKELAIYYEKQNATYQVLKNMCLYPALVVCSMMGTFIFFALKIVPMFAELYNSLGVAIPPGFGLLCNSINMVLANPLQSICIFILLLVVNYEQRERIKKCCLKLPGVAGCYKYAMEERYCRILSIMLSSGMPVLSAFSSAAEVLQNPKMQEKSQMTCNALAKGVSITQAISLNGSFLSDTTMELIGVGDDSGQLTELLEEAADIADHNLQNNLKRLKTLFEPILLMVLTVLLGAMLLVVILPITGLIANMPEYI